MPEVSQLAPSGMADPAIAPITAAPAPVRKACCGGRRNWSKREAPARMKQKDGAGAGGGEQTATETAGGIADDRYRLDHWAWGDLTQRHRVEELGAGHPVVGHHGVVLHEGDDHETSAIRQRAYLEGDPAQGCQAPDDRSRCSREQKEGGLAEELARPPWKAISTRPQPRRTSTRYGPIVAAEAPPARK